MATHGLPAWPWTEIHIEDLPPAEALLLEAMRRWADATRAGRHAGAMLRPPLVAEDVADAVLPLDTLLGTANAARPLHIACELCPRLAGDEPALLLALALTQRAPRRQALAAFCRLLPPPAAYAAMGPAIGIGLALRRAGLLLENPLRAERRPG